MVSFLSFLPGNSTHVSLHPPPPWSTSHPRARSLSQPVTLGLGPFPQLINPSFVGWKTKSMSWRIRGLGLNVQLCPPPPRPCASGLDNNGLTLIASAPSGVKQREHANSWGCHTGHTKPRALTVTLQGREAQTSSYQPQVWGGQGMVQGVWSATVQQPCLARVRRVLGSAWRHFVGGREVE